MYRLNNSSLSSLMTHLKRVCLLVFQAAPWSRVLKVRGWHVWILEGVTEYNIRNESLVPVFGPFNSISQSPKASEWTFKLRLFSYIYCSQRSRTNSHDHSNSLFELCLRNKGLRTRTSWGSACVSALLDPFLTMSPRSEMSGATRLS